MPEKTEVVLGGTKRFECQVIGFPRPEIRWYKDGSEITHDPRYKIGHGRDGTVSLVIEKISQRDEGCYRCRAQNSEGMASTAAYLFVRTKKTSHTEESMSVHSMSFTVTEDDDLHFEKSEFHRGQYETGIEQLENQTYGGMGIRDFTARTYGNEGIIQIERESEVITEITTRRMEGDERSSGSESSDEFDKLESMKSKIEYMAKMYEEIGDVGLKRTHDVVDGDFTESVDKNAKISGFEIENEDVSFSKKSKFDYEETIESTEQISKFSETKGRVSVTTKEEITTKEEMEIKIKEETESTKMTEDENEAKYREELKIEQEDIKTKKEAETKLKEEEENFTKMAASTRSVIEMKEESITMVKEEIKIKEEIQERMRSKEEELEKMVGFKSSVSETDEPSETLKTEVKYNIEVEEKTNDKDAEVVEFESSVSETAGKSQTKDSLELSYKSDLESLEDDQKEKKGSIHFDSSVETTEISTHDEAEKSLVVQSSSEVENKKEEQSSHLDASIVTMETKLHDQEKGFVVTSSSEVESKETVRSNGIETTVETMETESHDQDKQLLLAESEIKVESSETFTETDSSEMDVSLETSSTENIDMVIDKNKQKISEEYIDQKVEEAELISEINSSSAECEVLETSAKKEQYTIEQPENKTDEIALESNQESNRKLSPLSPKEKSPVTASEKTEVGAVSKLEELTTSPAVEIHELAEEGFLDSSVSKEEIGSTSLGQDSGIFDMSLRDSLLRGDESLVDSSLNETADVLDDSTKIHSATEQMEKEKTDLASKETVLGHTKEIIEVDGSHVEEKLEVEVQKVGVSEETEIVRHTETSEFSVMKADEIIAEALAERTEKISREDVAMAIEKLAVGDSVDPVEFSCRGAESRVTETRTEELDMDEEKHKMAELQRVEEQRPTYVEKIEEERAQASSQEVCLFEGSDLRQTSGTVRADVTTDGVTFEQTAVTEDKKESTTDQQEFHYQEETVKTVAESEKMVTETGKMVTESEKIVTESVETVTEVGKTVPETVDEKYAVCVEKQTDVVTDIQEQMSCYTEESSMEGTADTLTEISSGNLESAEATMTDIADLQKSAVGVETRSHSDPLVEEVNREREETCDLDGMLQQTSEVRELKQEFEPKTLKQKSETTTSIADVSEGLVLQSEASVENKPSEKQTASDELDGFTVKSEVEISESQKRDEDGLRLRTEVGVSETEYRDELKISSLQVETDATLAPPTIISVSEDVSVKAGETIHLSSEVQGNPRPEVKWFKAGDTVKPTERISVTTENDTYTLEISQAGAEDAGIYTLTAHNSEGTIFSDVQVFVDIHEPGAESSANGGGGDVGITVSLTAPEFVVKPEDTTVTEFEQVKLVCSVKGAPTPEVTWSKEGRSLQSDNHIRVYESDGCHYLEIPQTTTLDAGEYQCTATNDQGNVTCHLVLRVEGATEESGVSAGEDPRTALSPRASERSDTDVSDTATVRYMKLVAAMAAFSLVAFGINKAVQHFK